MIKMIFKQLWNQRKMNLWIFLEMLAVCFFLWLVLDPVYVLLTNRMTDRGYESHRRYVVDLGSYFNGHLKYDKTQTEETTTETFLRIARMVRDCPEVENYSISGSNAFPNAKGHYSNEFATDTTQVARENAIAAQWFYNYAGEGSQFFRTYGMKDARNGKDIDVPADIAERPLCYISAHLARQLFGTVEVVGKKVYDGRTQLEVAGVFEDYKHCDYEQPNVLLLRFSKSLFDFGFDFGGISRTIVFSLKEHVDIDAFEKRFVEEIAPQLEQGNFYFKGLRTFQEVADERAHMDKRDVKLYTQFALTGFTLLCIFLGTLGTFWVRCDERKQEIGVMRSMGATRGAIYRQFFIEAGLLVTLAALCILPVLLHYVYESGMYQAGGLNPQSALVVWGLEPIPHFCMVYLLTFLILLFVALIGTCLPVSRALKVHPVEALRDE